MKVLIITYSTYFDVQTGIQFEPVLVRHTGCYHGVADVTEEQAKAFEGRPAFVVMDAETFGKMTTEPEEPEPTEPTTGDPMTDASLAASAASAGNSGAAGGGSPLNGPPAPPTSK